MNKIEILEYLAKYKIEKETTYGILSLGLFGSVARGQENDESDIDIFISTKTPNPFIIVEIKEELEKKFKKHIDIVRLRESMNQYLKKRIEKEGVYV
jgi:predicted nucleotidyltransferase